MGYQKEKLLINPLIVMETAQLCATQSPKSSVTAQSSISAQKLDVKMTIPVDKRLEMSMENSAQITLTLTVARLNALQITINAHHLLTAQHSANLMKKNAQPQEKMIMAVPFHQHVLFKKETTMENYVPYIALVYVMKTKSCALEVETILDAKSYPSVNPCPRNCGEMMPEIGALDSAQPIAKIGNKFVLPYKILVMDAQQNPYANQKQRTTMESDAQDIVNLNAETDTLPNLKLELMPEDAPKLPYAYLHKQMSLSKNPYSYEHDDSYIFILLLIFVI